MALVSRRDGPPILPWKFPVPLCTHPDLFLTDSYKQKLAKRARLVWRTAGLSSGSVLDFVDAQRIIDGKTPPDAAQLVQVT